MDVVASAARGSFALLTVALVLVTGSGARALADPPSVLGVTPATGLTSGGTSVTVRGEGFVAGSTTVAFAGAQATSVSVDSPTQLTAVTSPSTAGAADVQATTPDGTSAVNVGDQFVFGLSAPGNLQLHAAGTTEVALIWTAPAVAGVTGYSISRDGNQIATTDAYTTNFLDTGRTPETTYVYTVTAQTTGGDTPSSDPLSVTTASAPTVLTQCSGHSLPSGHYVLAADITDQPSPCFTFDSDTHVSLDCQGHTMTSANVSITNSSHFLITDCNLASASISVTGSSDGTIAHNTAAGVACSTCTDIVVVDNSVTDGELTFGHTSHSYIGRNVATEPSDHETAADFDLIFGDHNVVDANTSHGGAASWQTAPHGSDDALVMSWETGDTIANNQFDHLYDCGIETVGYVSDSTWTNNTIDHAGMNGICAYAGWYSSWFNNSVLDNTVTHSGSLVAVMTAYELYGPFQSQAFFSYNEIAGNTSSDGIVSGDGPMSAAFADQSDPTIPLVDVGNDISNNRFDTSVPAPSVYLINYTASGNICAIPTPNNAAYSPACTTYTASAATVTSVAPTSGTIDGDTPLTLAGSGFTNATVVTVTQPGSPNRMIVVPRCGPPANGSPECFTVNSDSSIAMPSPVYPADATVDVRVTSNDGTLPAASSDQYSYTGAAAYPGTLSVAGPTGPSADGNPTFTISGAKWGATVDCGPYANGQFTSGTLPAGPDGSWQAGPYIAADGSYSFGCRQVDAQNVWGPVTTFSYVLSTPIGVQITSPTANEVLGSPSVAVDFAPSRSAVSSSCQLDGGAVNAACTSPVSYSNLTAGQHTVLVVATDAGGNTASDSVTFDYEPPSVAITAPTPSQLFGPGGVSITFTASNAVKVYCELDNAFIDVHCASPNTWNSSYLADGSHTMVVEVYNAAGDNTSARVSFRVDATPPVVSISSPASGSTANLPPTLVFTANDTGSGVASTTCQLDGGPAVACSSGQIFGVSAGAHTITVTAVDDAGNSASATTSFTYAPSVAPNASTDHVTATDATTATVDGSVNPGGRPTIYAVEYDLGSSTWCTSGGSSGSPANSTPLQGLGFTDTSWHSVTVGLTGLTGGTDYCADLVAANGSGSASGGQLPFTTFPAPPPPSPPAVTTGSATGVSTNAATIAGTVNPNGLATSYHFEYGTTTGYGSSTASASAGSASSALAESALLSGLSPNTAYHYRLVGTSSAGTSNGSDQTFTTPATPPPPSPPTVTTGSATGVSTSAATIAGTVNPNGLATSYHFEYGTTTGYGTLTASTSAGSGLSALAESVPLGGLAASTTYHFRLVGTSSVGTSDGSAWTFTTSLAPVVLAPPSVSGAALASKRFTAKQGMTLTLTLSEPATVTVVVTTTVKGHKVNGLCKASAKKGASCTLTVKKGSLTFNGVKGANSHKFRMSSLPLGLYTATLTARDAAGHLSKPFTVMFRIIRPMTGR